MFHRSTPIKDQIPNYKSLSKYSDEELYQFLEKNESTTPDVLACVCSEFLRRFVLEMRTHKEKMEKADD